MAGLGPPWVRGGAGGGGGRPERRGRPGGAGSAGRGGRPDCPPPPPPQGPGAFPFGAARSGAGRAARTRPPRAAAVNFAPPSLEGVGVGGAVTFAAGPPPHRAPGGDSGLRGGGGQGGVPASA